MVGIEHGAGHAARGAGAPRHALQHTAGAEAPQDAHRRDGGTRSSAPDGRRTGTAPAGRRPRRTAPPAGRGHRTSPSDRRGTGTPRDGSASRRSSGGERAGGNARRPHSRRATLVSSISFTQFVFVRSRPAMKTLAAASAARNWSWASGSLAIMPAISAPTASRSTARSWWCTDSARCFRRQPHPVDRRQRQLGMRLPRRRAGLPLVGPAAAVVHQELVEGSREPGQVRIGRGAQPVFEAIGTGVEGGPQSGRGRGAAT